MIIPLINPGTGNFQRKIRVGLPKGNLNNPDENRGWTSELLKHAGIKIEGYEPKKEAAKPISDLEGFEFYCMKPKQFPILLEEGALDMAILGTDTGKERYSYLWMNESELEKFGQRKFAEQIGGIVRTFGGSFNKSPKYCFGHLTPLEWFEEGWIECGEKIETKPTDDLRERLAIWRNHEAFIRTKFCDVPYNCLADPDCGKLEDFFRQSRSRINRLANLGYGRVDVVWATKKGKKSFKHKNIFGGGLERLKGVNICTAYPYTTYGEVLKFLDKNFISFHNILDLKATQGEKLNIFPMASNTEILHELGVADLVVDCVSSGESLRTNDLVRVGEPIISNSTAGLYLGSSIRHLFLNQELCRTVREQVYQTICNFTKRLLVASLEYGKTRQDSVHYQGGKK